MRRVVVLVLDGLRRDFLGPDLTPALSARRRRAQAFAAFAPVFPSTTRVGAASLATGCVPARHGLVGNTVALREGGRLVRADAGRPDFFLRLRAATGATLRVPTLAERLAARGGAIVFGNASPGAAYAHDPDGHGWVYHRAGSFGPGRRPVAADDRLAIAADATGDRAMTERFCGEVLRERRPALALLWCGDPDHTQHEVALGSPAHHAALLAADANAAMVFDAVDRLRREGDEVLLVACSDHGHQTAIGTVDIDAELVAAGLKQDADSADVVVAPNGTAALVYLDDKATVRAAAIGRFLRERPWAGAVFEAGELARVGLAPAGGLAFALSLREDDAPNEHGIGGRSFIAAGAGSQHLGCGQHGGIGRYETQPFLMIDGEGFARDSVVAESASIVDIAPTVLRHLGVTADGCDGRALHRG